MLNRRQIVSALLAAGPCALAGTARAETWPSKPVTILVPYPPGGPGDVMARSIGETMGPRVGQPVIVDYKPGGGGQIAGSAMLQSPADGYMMLLGEMSVLCSNKLLYRNFRYDPLVDFQAVAPLMTMPTVLYVPGNSPFISIAELVAASKQKPLNYASQGGGSVGHLLGEMLTSATGGSFNHVPYKGSAGAMTDVMGGQVDMLFDGIGAGLAYLPSGKIKALAVSGPQRLAQVPNVATTAESGLPDVSMSVWFGTLARAGTPAPVVARLNEEVALAMRQPKNVQRFGDLGFQPMSMSPAEFQSFMKSESDKWGAFIKARHIALD